MHDKRFSPCLSLWERWLAVRRVGEGLSAHHPVTNRVTPEVMVYCQGFRLVSDSGGTPPLIRHGFAVPPSPEGEGFGAAALGRCGKKRTWAAGGHAPALHTAYVLSPQTIEPYRTGCHPEVWVYHQSFRLELPAAARRPSQSPSVTALPEGEPRMVVYRQGSWLVIDSGGTPPDFPIAFRLRVW